MELYGPSGNRFVLRLIGFEFPLGEGNGHWLIVEIEATKDGNRWRAQSPCLETPDAPHLAKWLEGVAKGMRPKPIGFIEPNLRFEAGQHQGDKFALKVYLELELRPDNPGFVSAPDFWIDLLASRAELQAAAAELRLNLHRLLSQRR